VTPTVETLETRTLLSVDPVLVADLVAGAGGSNPNNFVNVNGTLFFSANDGTTVMSCGEVTARPPGPHSSKISAAEARSYPLFDERERHAVLPGQ
jgi:hypothetical protein